MAATGPTPNPVLVKVFIVDGSPEVRWRLGRAIADLGAEVVGEADDPRIAVELLPVFVPDVVVVDVRPPVDATLRVVTLASGLGARVLVLTALPSEVIVRRCFEAGAARVLDRKLAIDAVVAVLRVFDDTDRDDGDGEGDGEDRCA